MAHPNIEERRRYVQELLDEGIEFNHRMYVEVGKLFGCHHSAIRADILALTRDPRLPTPHVSQNLRDKIRKRDGQVCQYCGAVDGDREYVVEHVIPASRNGVARDYNLVMACQPCNATKGNEVWIPRNLDEITRHHPEWKLRILELIGASQPTSNYPKPDFDIEEEIERLRALQEQTQIQRAKRNFAKSIKQARSIAFRTPSILSVDLYEKLESLAQVIETWND